MKNTKKDPTEKYWHEAKAYALTHEDGWFAFEWKDDARWQWEKYFAWRFGFMPAGMNYLKQGKIGEFLVPCENPMEFDPGYAARPEGRFP